MSKKLGIWKDYTPESVSEHFQSLQSRFSYYLSERLRKYFQKK